MTAKRRRKGTARGRQSGGHNRGYWFRKGRGWYATENGKPVLLRAENGDHLKAPDTPADVLERAYARYLLGQQEQARRLAVGDTTPMLRIVQVYLQHCKSNNRESTFRKRGEYLFDFCYGLPPRFWDYDTGRKVPKPRQGGLPARWLWRKTRRPAYPDGRATMARQAPNLGQRHATNRGPGPQAGTQLRCFNAVDSPEPDQRLQGWRWRQTDHVLYARNRERVAARRFPGTQDGDPGLHPHRGQIRQRVHPVDRRSCGRDSQRNAVEVFPDESKTHKPRTIYVAPEIAELVRPLMKRYPHGPLFRNQHGKPWTIDALRRAFLRLKTRLAKKKIKLDDDACMYTCRHTFAKRTLGGYWSGKPCTIEQLAGLMGNTRQVCWEHYAKWCDNYTDPLWEAVAARPAS